MRIVSGVSLGLLVTVGVVATAGGLSRLPAARVLAGAEDSPGAVTFRHESHLDPEAPDCTTCHPRLFRIVPDAERPAAYR